MSLRALVIDDVAKERVRRLVEFAEEFGHWYRVDLGDRKPPGDDPRYVIYLDTFRCVFTITKNHDGLWRHLSISVPSSKMPNPFAAYTIAELFGFKGWDGVSDKPGPDWLLAVHHPEHCVVLDCPYFPTTDGERVQ